MSAADARRDGGALPTASTSQVWDAARRLARPHRKALLGAVAALVTATSLQLVATRILGAVIDAVSKETTYAHINQLGLAECACVIGVIISVFLGRYLTAYVCEHVIAQLRNDAFDATVALPLGVIERAGTGDPLSRLTSDVSVLAGVGRDAIPIAVGGVLIGALGIVALVATAPIMALGALGGVPIMVLAGRWYLRQAPGLYQQERRRSADVIMAMHEMGDGAATIRTFGREDDWLARFNETSLAEWHASWPPTRARSILFPLCDAATVFSLMTSLVVGAIAYHSGAISLGAVAACGLYIVQLQGPIAGAVDVIDDLQQSVAAMARLVGICVAPRDVATDILNVQHAKVDLDDVHFSYVDDATADGSRDSLHKVDLHIFDNERIAVVGPSGAGKSTIAKLVAGIHTARTGTVNVDETTLTRSIRTTGRGGIALVTQEAHLFLGTIASNLRARETTICTWFVKTERRISGLNRMAARTNNSRALTPGLIPKLDPHFGFDLVYSFRRLIDGLVSFAFLALT